MLRNLRWNQSAKIKNQLKLCRVHVSRQSFGVIINSQLLSCIFLWIQLSTAAFDTCLNITIMCIKAFETYKSSFSIDCSMYLDISVEFDFIWIVQLQSAKYNQRNVLSGINQDTIQSCC